jgi:hypothetical protein
MAGSDRSWRPRILVAAAAALAVVGVTAACSLTSPTPPPATPAAAPSVAATSPGANASASPAATWQSVVPAPLSPVATFEASAIDEAGVAPDARFALTSLTGETAVAMAARLDADPETQLAVAAGPDQRTATITPAGGLAPGTQYRFTLAAPDGSRAASWAFRVRSPVRVLSTIPGDRSTAVPTHTGIEVTFDQDGIADMRDHFSIVPATAGRFERHGRTQVFVPDALAAGTLYTVTVRAGLSRAGSDLALASDVVFRFETAGTSAVAPWLQFAREAIETSPTEATVAGVETIAPADGGGDEPLAITKAPIRVYRIPTLDAAAGMLADFLAAPRWTTFSTPVMATAGLPVVASFTAAVEPLADGNGGTIRFPERLPKGWYVAEIAGDRPSQAFLQVTSVSAWVSVLTDRTVVWVNDAATGGPIAAATARVREGATIGRSGADGLVIGPTPDALVPPAEAGDREVPDSPPLLEVEAPRGDVVLVPFEVAWDGDIYRGEWWEMTGSADATYWSMLLTERGLYRTTDVIDVWGYLRGRDDGSVPPAVELRLVRDDAASSANPPVAARADATPDRVGAFSASMAVSGLPVGYYRVQALAGGRVVATAYVEIGVIRKPAYDVALAPDHRAVLGGTTVQWTTTATFFDGTAVADLRVMYYLPDGADREATTDVAGRDVQSIAMTADDCSDEWCHWDTDGHARSVSVRPAAQEEGEIDVSEAVIVFPTSHDVDLDGRLDGRTLRVTGSVDEVDLARVEAAIEAGTWGTAAAGSEDPDGAPVPRATVRVIVTELVPVRRQVGTGYDFIEKTVVPRYEYDTQRRTVRTLTVRTGPDGRFTVKVAAPDAGHQYEVTAETADPQGRPARRLVYVGAGSDPWADDAGVRFQRVGGGEAGTEPYGIGEEVAWRMTGSGVPVETAPSDRYLYIVAQRGLRSAAVSTSPVFERTFGAADAPRIFVIGVRFTGSTYAPKAAAWADFDTTERELAVTVTADRSRYRPGEDATLTITTRDPAGRPVAASVILQAVDEKLFAMGRASVPEPLDRLYAPVDSGIVRLTSTHQVPVDAGPEGEGGSTTANLRSDFRDTVAFRALSTDASGRATTTIRLSDDLTSWHVSVSAMTADLEAGVDDLLVPVGLPLFADVTVADDYLVSDRPIIRLRAFGDALRPGDPVVFTVASSSLGLPETRLSGTAFRDVDVTLPELALGSQVLEISVTSPTRLDAAGDALADHLVRTFDVVRSRLSAARTEFVEVGGPLPTIAGGEAATYTFTDAGRARYVPYLDAYVEPSGLRVDRAIAASTAHALLVSTFGRDPASLPPDTFDPARYPVGTSEDEGGARTAGASLLPYGGLDPWLAARVAVLAPGALDAGGQRLALEAVRDDAATRRDLRIATLAGLSALGEPVTDALDAARAPGDLSVTELLYLGLGYAAAGDDASAAAIEHDLLSRHGEQLGPWVRLQAGTPDATTEATALLAVLAARVGDPLAPSMMDYARAQPTGESSVALELVTAAQGALERTPTAAAAFAYTLDGERTEVRLEPGESQTLVLSAAQRAGLRLEPVAGKTGLAVAWRAPADPAALAHDAALALTRRLPTGTLPVDRPVMVEMHVAFAPSAPDAPCYEVVEEVPSGLAPLTSWDIGAGDGVVGPASIVGQRVTFCVGNPVREDAAGRKVREATLRYAARVVNEGIFTWEPAVMQLEGAADVGTTVPGGSVTIGTR